MGNVAELDTTRLVIAAIIGLASVSYTHLDVYKRQVSGGHSFGIHGKYFFFHVLSYSNRTATGRKSA